MKEAYDWNQGFSSVSRNLSLIDERQEEGVNKEMGACNELSLSYSFSAAPITRLVKRLTDRFLPPPHPLIHLGLEGEEKVMDAL